jgi:hypothetical protein
MLNIENIQKIDIHSSEYPQRLREIPDPPETLYCAGDISLLKADSVSVVGSRKYTLLLMIGQRKHPISKLYAILRWKRILITSKHSNMLLSYFTFLFIFNIYTYLDTFWTGGEL